MDVRARSQCSPDRQCESARSMKNADLEISLPVDQNLPDLLASFQDSFAVGTLPGTVCHRFFYDTFDWLLYNNGAVLEVHENGQARRIYWRPDPGSTLKIQLGLKQVPQLASDLPDSRFRRELQSVISVRELIPRIEVKINRLPLVVLDPQDRAAVHIDLDEYRYVPSGTVAGAILDKRVTIKPVKGHTDDFDRVEAFFHPLQQDRVPENVFTLALAESGKSTTEYSNKLNLSLEPEMTAEQALKLVLLRLLDILQQNTAGSIRGRDIEYMHDFRVSIRKTRSALTQVEQVLPLDKTALYNKFFAGLGKLTNPVRDLDVFLLTLDKYRKWLKKPARRSMEPVQRYLAHTREAAQQEFIKTLDTREYRDRVGEWREYLESSRPTRPPLENTQTPVGRLAGELIWDMYRLALDEGNVITDESRAEALHELRKTCKKLRYLMEFFQSLYPAKNIRELIQAMKALQDNLGEFNDLHVHAVILKKFIRQSDDKRANKACKQLIKALKRAQAKTRSRFAERYAAFASTENQNRFMELFADSRTG
jgi:CHAD domain-containing protein